MVEVIKILSIIAFVVGGVCLLLAIFFWFRFRIMSVINDLTGKTAKKAIEQIRRENEKNGGQTYRSSAAKIRREPLGGSEAEDAPGATSTIPLPMPGAAPESDPMLTDRLAPSPGAVVPETTLYQEEGKTELLLHNEGTTVLNQSATPAEVQPEQPSVQITVLDEVVFVHTEEVII